MWRIFLTKCLGPMPTSRRKPMRNWRRFPAKRQTPTAFAQYWMRQAQTASVERPRDGAVLLWLKVLTIGQQPEAVLQTRRILTSGSLSHVRRTFRHAGWVISAYFSPDGRRVVTASYDKHGSRLGRRDGRASRKALKHEGWVYSASFSPDGRRVVTASDDKTAHVWDAETGTPLGNPLKHKDSVSSASFSPDGRRVVTASADNTARVWDAETGTPSEPLEA